MQYLIDFLENSDVQKTKIFSQLRCSKEEAEILKYLTNKYIKGEEESSVFLILSELFSKKKYEHIQKLQLIRNLLESGWIVQGALSKINIGKVANLELINSTISLSSSFVKLLEKGSLEDMNLPKATAYNDHLEYLKDQFLRVELYQKISTIRQNYATNSIGVDRLENRLKLLEERIAQRVKTSKKPLSVEIIFKENKLNTKEQIIFLLLLKEEYSGSLESFRDINTLIDIVSVNDYDKIKNRSLLEEGSTLIEKEIVDYEEVLTTYGGVSRNFYINEDILQQIMHPHKEKKRKKVKLKTLVKEQTVFELISPKTSIEDVVLNPKTKKILENILKQMDKNVLKLLKEWGVKDKKKGIETKLIFYGPAGTGKTMTALSLAKSLNKKVLSFDCSKILSMYVGESEKNVRKIFDDFKDIARQTKSEPVLLLNEADQFLSSRTTSAGGSADKMHNQMQNIFLEQIEKFDGILIATTNLLESIDQAFSRRFDYKIEFAKPTFEQRVLLWEKMLPKTSQYEKSFDIKLLAKYNLTGGQIKVVIKNTALSVAVKKEPIFSIKDFIESIKKEISGSFGEAKTVGFVN